MEGPVVFLLGGITVQRLQERNSKFGCVRPVIERIPLFGLGSLWRDASDIGVEIRVRWRGNFQVARQDIEYTRKIGRALNIGVAAKGIDAAAGASHIAEQKLRHGRGADNLRTEGVLGPAHRVNNGADLFCVSIFADLGVYVPGLGQFILWDSRNAGD